MRIGLHSHSCTYFAQLIPIDSWENYDHSTFGEFNVVMANEMQTFLDELFYNTKPDLVDFEAVKKAQNYFETCHQSTLDMETLYESIYIQSMIASTTFYNDSNSWGTVCEYVYNL